MCFISRIVNPIINSVKFSFWVSIVPMQPLVIVYYLMTLVCDLNAHLRGKVTWCVPLTFSFTGVNKNYLTRFINTMPTDKNTMPADKNTMSADKNTMPTDKNTMPADKNTMPTDKNTMPAEKNTMPTDKNTMPADNNTMSTDKNTMPADKNTMPTDKVRNVTLASDFFVKLYSRDNFSIV